MSSSLPLYAILLRAIGPVTHKLMRMEQWRAASSTAGFVAPETLVNTGNMLAGFDGDATAARNAMEPVLRGFGLGENVAVIVRTPAQLRKLLKADPIAEAAAQRPSQTGVYFFAAAKPDFGWISDHDGPELIHVVADHLVVDFSQDVAQSGRLIRKIDKLCGLNTSRNWNTTRKLAERASQREKE
ncbi:DUF1697 domain-containing protein [Devosia sp. XJ19-1]|uniref:DUF1697 domain-containing protein n=1 Tax=Devosia ureilytica TaxID=2952754 RepID=A0A9Q4AKW8_9HYPH|nr:DUF1697 domain-containing protein [Devosia ureilytica]MCP8882592.1 DUF1697 domain-containing protein [Devosia ureilytica]MCP8885521.1 DUF1697 domain-containing protein [Devosia ureilytica]